MEIRERINPTVLDIRPSGIRRFFNIVSEMKDVISLGIGEPDFVTPWHICDAGIYSLEKGITCYTANAGLLELRREICKYLERRFGLGYDPATQVVVTVGGSEAIDLAVRTLVRPGDEVIIPEPCFVCYDAIVRLAGGEIAGKMTILAEGDATERDDIIYLEKLPLFNGQGEPI